MLRFVADLETNNNVNDCRVWAAGIAEVPAQYTTSPMVRHWNNLGGLMEFLSSQEVTHEVYFHNAKFDAQFLIDYLINNGYELDEDLSKPKTFRTLITTANVFYSLEICHWAKTEKNGKDKKTGIQRYKTKRIVTKVIDSFKKIPLSVDGISKAFGFEVTKGSIDYNLDRPEGYVPTLEEIDYLQRDIIIVARALSLFVEQGFTKLTLSADALKSFKEKFSSKTGREAESFYRSWFPKVDKDMDKFIRRAYKGGFVCVKEGEEGVLQGEGVAYDVNSLYPSVMRYAPMPFGRPASFKDFYYDDINKLYHSTHPLFIQEFVCDYKLKPNKPAMAQVKRAFMDSEYSTEGRDGNFCMTNVDLNLFFECYEVTNFRPLGGLCFRSHVGIFNNYIDYWMAEKERATIEGNAGNRLISKLFCNGLYGKFATTVESFVNIPYMDQQGVVKYKSIQAKDKEIQYTALSAFITSYGRQVLFNAILSNWDRFIYCDTDSIHLKGFETPANMYIDDVALGAWKCEGYFKRGLFLKQKAYMEEYIKELVVNETTGEITYQTVTKLDTLMDLDEEDMETEIEVKLAGATQEIKDQINFTNFYIGSTFGGRRIMKTVKGGRVIEEGTFTIR